MEHAVQKDETTTPLLSDKHEIWYPNCPGCKCAHLSADGAGPPVKELIMVATLFVCSSLPISSLYPFLYFMVEDFHIAKTEDIGYYAGAIGSIFMCGRMMSSVFWGRFADKMGRKPVMYIGLISIIVFQQIFGMSKTFYVAFTARFLLGAFNGIQGPMKAYASEICSEANQPWATAVVGTSWSLGLIIGPAIGGFLARPAVNFPTIFREDSLFARFPYLLPSICQAVFAAIELGVVYYLPETIHKHEKVLSADVEQPASVELVQPQHKSLWRNWPLMASVGVYCAWSLHETAFAEVFSLWCVSPVDNGGLGLQTTDVGTVLTISGGGMVILQMILFAPFAKYFGAIMATRTPAIFVEGQSYDLATDPFAGVTSAQIIVIPLVLLFLAVPVLHGLTQWIILNLLAVARNTLSSMVTTATFLLVNNSVPPKLRGEANGISLSSVSIFRAIGPATAGALFAFGQSRKDAKFLPGNQLVFAVMALVCVLALFTMFPPFLPDVLDRPFGSNPLPETVDRPYGSDGEQESASQTS